MNCSSRFLQIREPALRYCIEKQCVSKSNERNTRGVEKVCCNAVYFIGYNLLSLKTIATNCAF